MTKKKADERNTPSDKAEQGAAGVQPAAEPQPAPDVTEEGAPDLDAAAPTPEQLEIARLTDRLLRLQADFDNFRKRQQREREEWAKRASEDLVRDLIPVLDHFEFGIRQAEGKADGGHFAEGMRMIFAELRECLRKHGVETVEAKGLPFDPMSHEAVAHLPSDAHPEGMVTEQTLAGYRMAGRLLRAAMVVVSSGAPADGAGPGDGTSGAEA